jgi:hypothetical protein
MKIGGVMFMSETKVPPVRPETAPRVVNRALESHCDGKYHADVEPTIVRRRLASLAGDGHAPRPRQCGARAPDFANAAAMCPGAPAPSETNLSCGIDFSLIVGVLSDAPQVASSGRTSSRLASMSIPDQSERMAGDARLARRALTP